MLWNILNFGSVTVIQKMAREVVKDYESTYASICFKRFRESNHKWNFSFNNFVSTVTKVNFKRYIHCSEEVRF